MTAPVLTRSLALRRDARLDTLDDGGLQLAAPVLTVRLPPLGPALVAGMHRLAKGPVSDGELTGIVTEAEGMSAAIKLQLLLRRLDGAGWLEHGLLDGDAAVAVLRPLGHVPVDAMHRAPEHPVRLSRFAVLRASDGSLTAETGRSALAVELVDARCAELVAGLAKGIDPHDVPADAAVLGFLDAAGLLTDADPEKDTEVTEQRLAQWSGTDLMLHATARSGRRGGGYGGTYRLTDRFDPLPAVAATAGRARVEAAVPDLHDRASTDPPLTTVIESRRSLREHDDAAPITVDQLGELLYRAARTRRTDPVGNDELVDRPFPAGGSLGELEVYPLVTNCKGLDPGIWHYDGVGHAFEHVAEPSRASAELLAHARAASLMDRDPQVLLVITARFGRVMWKYEAMAYALSLKHVGVLYQTLYLVATAMGLAPCAQGGGNADLFAAATDLDYYQEGSVGEFVIGSRASDATSMWEANA